MSDQPEFFAATFPRERLSIERVVDLLGVPDGMTRDEAMDFAFDLQAKIAVEILTSPPREPLPDEQRWRVFPVYD